MVKRLRREVGDRFLPLPAEPTRELRWDLPEDWDGAIPVDADLVRGARVKPVVTVPEARLAALDPEALRARILELGATYCKAPLVHVLRKRTARDERHATELPLEDSLAIFAEETRVRDPEEAVRFAAALAREADAGGGA